MDGLPETFSIREAFDLLGWQGSRKGLARHLEAQGYTKALWHDPRSRAARWMWLRPCTQQATMPAPVPTASDEWECGGDEQIAHVALRLIERNSISTAEAFYWLESQITTAGPRFCREMLTRLSSEEVPF